MRRMLKWARLPCLAHINGALLLHSLYRDGANDAATHHSHQTGRGVAGIGVFENVRTREGESAFS